MSKRKPKSKDWQEGRIHGLREAANLLMDPEDARKLRDWARKLRRRIGK